MNTAVLDEAVFTLKVHKDDWARLGISRKQEHLRFMLERQVAIAERQVTVAAQAKRSPLTAEDWASGVYPIVRYLDLLHQSLAEVSRQGHPRISQRALRTRTDGQLVVTVVPTGGADKVLYRNFRGEVWMSRQVTRENLDDHLAGFYRQKDPQGKVALVLGAGNVASIAPLDVLHKLYVEGQVCLLKLNPVNDYLGPFLEDIFSGLIAAGYVRIVQGGSDVGEYLCQHGDIDEIHLTGSNLTHDAIIFGQGNEGLQRKQENRPRLTKRMTSELGNVSPVIVAPGPWTKADLQFHAENIATQMVHNGGCNCCAAQVLVLPSEWDLKKALLDEIRAVLSATPPRKAYYPGAQERYERFVQGNPNAEVLSPRTPGSLPWTLIPDLSPDDSINLCYTTESFCGLMAQTSLTGDAEEFLQRAVAFCNDRLWGTLNACVIIHPKTARSLGARLEEFIAALRYGTVGINHWPVLSFVWGATTWGAIPGHEPGNIQSGVGSVHNALLFDGPERSVIYGPFRVWPKPAWFITNRKADEIFRRLVAMHARPGFAKVLGVAFAALGG